jgi:hypothetical protein
MSSSYDHPNAETRREACLQTVAGAAGVSARFASFQKARLFAVHAQVVTAGTSAGAGNVLIVKQGTTALGTFTQGTDAAGTKQSITGLNAALASGDVLSTTNGTDATGNALVTYEYEVENDASRSV